MNRLSKYNTVKILHLLCVICGILLLFINSSDDALYSALIKITGLVLTMYGLFSISTKWTNKEQTPDDDHF